MICCRLQYIFWLNKHMNILLFRWQIYFEANASSGSPVFPRLCPTLLQLYYKCCSTKGRNPKSWEFTGLFDMLRVNPNGSFFHVTIPWLNSCNASERDRMLRFQTVFFLPLPVRNWVSMSKWFLICAIYICVYVCAYMHTYI